jgi:protein-tyrosine phosphatase
VQASDFEYFDLIVGMDAGNVDELCDRAATIEQQSKVVMMGDYIRRYPHYDYVPDPYYEGSEGFELVLDLLEDSCECLLDSILQQNNIL